MKFPIQLHRIIVVFSLLVGNSQNEGTIESLPDLFGQCSDPCPSRKLQDHSKGVHNTSGLCADVDFPEPPLLPPYDFDLPKCMNITLTSERFKLGGDQLKAPYVDEYYGFSEDNQTVQMCYLLSPQLQNCNLKRLDGRQYRYSTNYMAIFHCKTHDYTALGDFYVIPDGKKTIVACDKTPLYAPGIEKRCEYVDLEPSEYELMEDKTTIRMLPSNPLIRHALYNHLNNSSKIRMCFPLTAEMTKCKTYTFKKYEYSRKSDYRIFSSKNRKYFNLGDYQINATDEIASVCQYEVLYRDFYKYCHFLQVVSAALIVLSVILHVIFPGLNFHAKPLLCQMISLAIFYIATSYRYLCYPENETDCYIVFGFCYFAGLTSFFWLNVLSFDLWSIFASSQTSAARLCEQRPKFLLYCVYSYAIPAVMTILIIVLETHPSMQEELDMHPDILADCWLSEPTSLNVFYFGPVFFMLCVNMIFFVLTICNLRRASEGTQMVNKNRNKQLFIVCVKIFVILGLCWNIQFIANLMNVEIAKPIAFAATSIQGILLFIVYICKPSTYHLLKRKLLGMKSSSSNQTTETSASKDQGAKHNSNSDISMDSGLSDQTSIQDKSDLNISTRRETTSV